MREIDPNPRKTHHYKIECHKLLEELFGNDKKGRNKAYTYLKVRFKRDVHFSKINDPDLLREIFQVLWIKSFRLPKKTR